MKLFHRYDHGKRDVPDVLLQHAMYQDATNESLVTCVLISGDGGLDMEGGGGGTVLKDLYKKGWQIEVDRLCSILIEDVGPKVWHLCTTQEILSVHHLPRAKRSGRVLLRGAAGSAS